MAPVYHRPSRPDRTRHPRTPDIFDARAHAVWRWLGPFVMGLVYGYWAATNRRHGGPITTGNLVFGFVTAVVFAVIMGSLLYLAWRLPSELHAFAWCAFSGAALGFLIAQSGGYADRWLVGVSAGFGVLIGLINFYWAHTHEDARGNRIG
jgi:hypothetical protein